jgi:ParB family chromosome partitioning protein
MTSGQFTNVLLSQIWVNRSDRQRRELNGIDNLADSIRRLGLIHPIVITRDYELKAGERRFEACKSLGWTTIPAQFYDEVDPTNLLLLELEENTKRLDITWQEQCRAIEQYHALRSSQDPEWTQIKTAEALGEDVTVVGNKLAVAKEMKVNKHVAEAPKYSIARNVTRRVSERRAQATLETIAPKEEKQVPLLNADFIEWLETYSGPKFNFIHCDFPYGINFHEADRQGAVRFGEDYDDSYELYQRLVHALARVPVHESAHLLFWFSMDHYCWTMETLNSHGWKLNPFPLIWSKGAAGILPDPQRGPRRVYETAFMASRGDRKIVRSVANHIAFWSSDRIHQSEKPKEVLRHFFQMFVDEYSVVLDPTCGSGNAIKVAEEMGAKYVLGIEKEKEFYEEAKKQWTDAN